MEIYVSLSNVRKIWRKSPALSQNCKFWFIWRESQMPGEFFLFFRKKNCIVFLCLKTDHVLFFVLIKSFIIFKI